MSERDFMSIAMELALLAAGHKFPRLSQVGAAWGEDVGGPTKVDIDPPSETPQRIDTPSIDGYSFFLLDITFTEAGQFHLIEANGSNAALSSSVLGRDDRRAKHMFLAYKGKRRPPGQVVVCLAYQQTLIHIAEYFSRAGIFAERVGELETVRLCNIDENLGDEDVSIVCGTIPTLAQQISRKGDTLYYRGRPIVFACNPNLLAELARTGTIAQKHGSYDVDVSIYHEGRCTPFVHDKGIQQDAARGTAITPLEYYAAGSQDECLAVLRRFRDSGRVAVGKMNAGSGGAGIEIFRPDVPESDAIATLDRLVDVAVQKYGPDAQKTLYPIRFFEFAKSTLYDVYGSKHLWDMRMQCLIYPGYVEVTPCVIRLCPDSFDGTYTWDTVVSNLTGRDPIRAGRLMRSPAAMRRSQPVSVLEAIGISKLGLATLMQGCAKWCEAAWHMCR